MLWFSWHCAGSFLEFLSKYSPIVPLKWKCSDLLRMLSPAEPWQFPLGDKTLLLWCNWSKWWAHAIEASWRFSKLNLDFVFPPGWHLQYSQLDMAPLDGDLETKVFHCTSESCSHRTFHSSRRKIKVPQSHSDSSANLLILHNFELWKQL